MSYFENVKQSFKWKHYVNYIVVALCMIFFIFLFTTGSLKRSNADLLVQICYSIILAVSLNLVVGFLGELSLGHAGFMCVGAYLGCYLSNTLNGLLGSPLLSLILSMAVGGLVAAIFGLVIGLPALRLKGDYLAIVTLAFGEIVRNIFKNMKTFGGALGLSTTKYGSDLFIIAFVMVLITLIVTQNLIRSKHGRAITAIRDNEIAAKAMGINVTYYKLFVFVIAAFFAGIAGVLYGHMATPVLYSFFSYNYSIEILVMVVLGGMGSINGSIIAATLITYINFVLQSNLSGDLAALKNLVYALILIVVVVFNNAPALARFKERLNFGNLVRRFTKKKSDPAAISDDSAAWNRIPTKIKMDEILSADLKVDDPFVPDTKSKGKDDSNE